MVVFYGSGGWIRTNDQVINSHLTPHLQTVDKTATYKPDTTIIVYYAVRACSWLTSAMCVFELDRETYVKHI